MTLQYLPPKDSQKYKNFYTILASTHGWTTIVLFFYYTNQITPKAVLYSEMLTTILKWKAELNYGYTLKDYDLTIHHLIVFTSVYIMLTFYRDYAYIIPNTLVVHLPLTFNCLKRIQTNPKQIQLYETMYLITWLPSAAFRVIYIYYISYQANQLGYKTGRNILFFFALLVTSLDYYWTPWKKYKAILLNDK
jgi:hypothetical protein